MANKKQKTQAEKTASAAKAKNMKNNKKTPAAKQAEPESKVPVRLISSVVLLALAVLFAIILF